MLAIITNCQHLRPWGVTPIKLETRKSGHRPHHLHFFAVEFSSFFEPDNSNQSMSKPSAKDVILDDLAQTYWKHLVGEIVDTPSNRNLLTILCDAYSTYWRC